MPHLFRLLLIFGLVILASGTLSAEPEMTFVSQDQLENGGLILPMGTVHPPGLGWDWLVSDGIYVALPPEGGPDETLTVAYFQIAGGGSKEQFKAQLKKELLSESESPQAEETFQIKDSSRPLFGEAFEATWKDEEYFCSGVYTRAKGHTLLLLYQATSRDAADSGMTRVLEKVQLSREAAQAQAVDSKVDKFFRPFHATQRRTSQICGRLHQGSERPSLDLAAKEAASGHDLSGFERRDKSAARSSRPGRTHPRRIRGGISQRPDRP